MISVDFAHQLTVDPTKSYTCPLQRVVSRAQLHSFLLISEDQAPIHNPESDRPVIPGNLLLSLIPKMLQSGLHVKNNSQCMTVKLSKVRFHQTMSVDEALSLSFKIIDKRDHTAHCFITTELSLRCNRSQALILSSTQMDSYFR